jgi:hypothetical protein
MHIIEERREIFPENVQCIPDNTITIKINNALELGTKMQKWTETIPRQHTRQKYCVSRDVSQGMENEKWLNLILRRI